MRKRPARRQVATPSARSTANRSPTYRILPADPVAALEIISSESLPLFAGAKGYADTPLKLGNHRRVPTPLDIGQAKSLNLR